MSDPLYRTLAARLREERRRCKLSLRRLAELSGLSTTTVHQIEAGRGSPSLGTLQSLASSLGVAVVTLLEPGGTPGDASAVYVAAPERSRAPLPGGRLERLAGGLPEQRFQGLVVTLAPGAATGETAMVHAGQELVLGLAGRCSYEVGGREYPIAPGDSLLLDSRQPHRARNRGRRDARFLLVLETPDAESIERHARQRS